MTTPPRRRYVSVMIHRDGALESHTYHLPVWAYHTFIGLGALLALGVLAGLLLVAPLARSALRVPNLEQEVRRLKSENAQVGRLAAALDSVGRNYERVRQMLGADVVPDLATVASDLLVAPSVLAHAAGDPPRFVGGASLPRYWPLDEPGFITRGLVGDSTLEESHPGLDIAVSSGSLVRASGGGSVAEAGSDAEYGQFVVIDHPSGYQSKYGHLSRVVVRRGDVLEPGAVIGLSGSTGRSTAPHLHFEIRHGGRSVDPLILVKEAR